MEIKLRVEGTEARINLQGAWVTSLSDKKSAILYPKRSLKAPGGAVKQRGGCHVCLPNFGPGGTSSQPQHGFARDMLWHIHEKTDRRAILTLGQGGEGYETLAAVLHYELGTAMLAMELRLTNNGTDNLRVAPGFHPYLMAQEADSLSVNGETHLFVDLYEAVFTPGSRREVTLPGRQLTLESYQLPVWALWTDQLGPYVCVEPTVGGFTFLSDTPIEDELLRPGQSKKYSAKIEWR